LEGLFTAVARNLPDRIVSSQRRNPKKSVSIKKINKKTGHRIRYLKVDAGRARKFQTKRSQGLQVDKDRYLEVTKDELENIALESTRTIEIDEFVPLSEDR